MEPVVTQIEHNNNYIVEEDEDENESEAMHANVSPNTRNKNSRDSKNILVLIRGDPKVMLDKCYGKTVGFTEESRKLQEEKGFHVELLGKLTLHMMDVTEIKKAYESPTMDKGLFYKNLDKYISKV